jgi:large subunit ribosomal protein L6
MSDEEVRSMSRIGKQPVVIPSGVEVTIGEDNLVRVKGPKGSLERRIHPRMRLRIEEVERDGKKVRQVRVERPSDDRQDRALHGLSRTLIANMVQGVTQGFEKVLEINGVGYRATQKGKGVELQVGFSHPVYVEPDPGVEIVVEGNTRIVVRGADKEKVGNTAARIRAVKKVEPYKGKGIKYADEVPRRKAGKQAKAH